MYFPAFDTHAGVKKLIVAGFSESQAEAQIEVQTEIVLGLSMERLVTKEDFFRFQKEDFFSFQEKTEKNFAEIRKEFSEFRQETHHGFAILTQKIVRLEERVEGKFQLLYWMFGFLIATMGSMAVKLWS